MSLSAPSDEVGDLSEYPSDWDGVLDTEQGLKSRKYPTSSLRQAMPSDQ
jgi:hypothetical protein